MRILFTAFPLLLAAVPVMAQTLTPREIFYGQYGKTAPAPKPAAERAKKKAVEASPQASAQAPPTAPERRSERPEQVSSPASRSDVQYAAVKNETRPLALRYSIKRAGECGFADVDPETTFRTKDQVRVVLQANDTGYLHVFQEGSSGQCGKLFPAGEGTYRVQAGEKATIPPDGDDAITLDEPAGVEKVYIVFSRQSEPGADLQSVLKLCSTEPKVGEKPHAMLAQNLGITQEDGQRTFARDLVIEKQKVVRPKPAAAEEERCKSSEPALGEAAVYVVNRNAGANGRVVASFELRHQ